MTIAARIRKAALYAKPIQPNLWFSWEEHGLPAAEVCAWNVWPEFQQAHDVERRTFLLLVAEALENSNV